MMTNTRWWHAIIGCLFSVGFLSSLVALYLSSDKGVLVGVVGLMSGALLLWLMSPRLSEFSMGPKGVAAKVSRMEQELQDQSERVREQEQILQRQQELVNELVKYSMSASIFHHLCGIALLKNYTYHDSDVNRREMYFLRDNGFIQPKSSGFLDFNSSLHQQNLVDVAEPTPIGWSCIKLRKEEIPENMLQNTSNLRKDPKDM